VADRTLLVVSQRPLDLGGGGSVRWQHLRRVLPRHGWRVVECSPPVRATANDAATDPRIARLAARRARVMHVAARLLDPLARAIGIQPEALSPNNVWSLTGRRTVRKAIEQEHPEVVLATVPPPSALLATAAVASVPFVAEFRDLWAGSPYFDRGGRLLPALERRALAHAAAVITVTEGFRHRLLALHPELAPRLHVFPNGFDPTLLASRRQLAPLDGRPAALIHAGALYGDRTAVGLLKALARPELRGRVRLELVGVIDPETRRALDAVPDLEVTLGPPVSWEDAIERTVAADVAVIINTPGTGGDIGQVPGKIYEVLALGRPVLALMRDTSEAARLLKRFGQGLGLAPPDDPAAIAAAIERVLEHPPSPVPPEALAEFDRDRIASRYAALLDELATRSSSATSSGTTASRR
jgi:glycosyltransferase involved in cell wall biosynthesis